MRCAEMLGAQSRKMLESRAELIAENIRRVAGGETPLNVVDP
jgi:hypothetical protein